MAGKSLTLTIFGEDRSASKALLAVAQQAQRTNKTLQQLAKSGKEQAASTDRSGDSFGGFVKKAAAIVGVGALVKGVAKTFGDFEQGLNQLQAVGGASAEQMVQVSGKARALGKSIAGITATDASTAMLELAKGGLSVDQAMTAATGTLQLAAAAQTDAGTAAEIQSKALNTFGLSADQANKVADVLANTANAASGEITDFGMALSQGGLSAANLGISVEDTATALGLFANKGLQGSDAGTSLKTMLNSMTPASEKAAGAMDELGIKAFDSQGNFVGLEAVTQQLAAAQANMTQEQFAATAEIAFGSDAVRAASALATSGAGAWTQMSTAVGEAGGAQKMAAANTMGLNGAIDMVKASVEDGALALGEKLAPAATEVSKKISSLIPTLVEGLAPALTGIGDAAIDGVDLLGNAAASAVTVLTPVISLVSGITGVFVGLPAPIQAVVVALIALTVMRGRVTTLAGGIRTGFQSATSSLGLFGRQVAFLRGQRGLSGLAATAVVAGARIKGFARGLSSAFGGPVGLAIIGITTAIAFFAGRNADAAAKVQAHNDKVAQLGDTMDTVTGKITDATKAQVRQDFGSVEADFSRIGLSAGVAGERIISMFNGTPKAIADVQAFRDEIVSKLDFKAIGEHLSGDGANFVDVWSSVLDMAGEDILRVVATGGPALAELEQRLLATGRSQGLVSNGINILNADIAEMPASISPASGAYSAFTSQIEAGTPAMQKNIEKAKAFRQSLAEVGGVDFSTLNRAFEAATASGGSLETVLGVFGIKGPQAAKVIAELGDAGFKAADGNTYLTQQAATAADATAKQGDAAAAAVKGNEDAAEAVGQLGQGMTDAEPPARSFESVLSDTKTAADNVAGAVDMMAAAILRAAGVDVTAEEAQRENEAALRGVTAGILEKVRAQQDLARSTDGITRAQQDQAEAEAELSKLKTSALEEDETRADRDKAIAEGAQKVIDARRGVTDAIRAEQDAKSSNAEASTADAEAMEKAAQSAATMAAQATNNALATGSMKDAIAAGTAEMAVQRQAFIDSAVAAGMPAAAAAKLADTYGLIPKNVKTGFVADVAAAESNGSGLFRVYDKTNKTWTAQFLTAGEVESQVKAGQTVQAYNQAKGKWTGQITADNFAALTAVAQVNASKVAGKFFDVDANINPALAALQQLDRQTVGNKSLTVTEVRQTHTINAGPRVAANGLITGMAAGGLRSPMIAPGGSNILWAEPETGWEAYIPGAASKRPRSEMLLAEVARRFGKMVIDRPTAMAQGGITTMAAGGLPSASALAGIAGRSQGERLGRTSDAISSIREFVKALDEAAADLREQRAKSKEDYQAAMLDRDRTEASGGKDIAGARNDVEKTRAEGRSKVREAEQHTADKLSDQRKANAERLEKAEDRLSDARKAATTRLSDAEKRTTKTAADRAARDAAIAKAKQTSATAIGKAERNLVDVQGRNARYLAQTRRNGAAAEDQATKAAGRAVAQSRAKLKAAEAAAGKDNRAADKKVALAKRQLDIDVKAAGAATRRAAAESRALAASAKGFTVLSGLTRRYDNLTGQVETSDSKVSGIRSDRAGLAQSVASSVAGLGGGIFGNLDQRGSLSSQLRGGKFTLGQITGFGKNVNSLKGKGLSASVLADIAGGGEDGVRLAAILARGSKAEIAQYNKIQTQIKAAAGKVGTTAADAMYAKKFAAAQKENADLRAQQRKTDSMIRDLAHAFDGGLALEISPQGIARVVRRGEKQLSSRGA